MLLRSGSNRAGAFNSCRAKHGCQCKLQCPNSTICGRSTRVDTLARQEHGPELFSQPIGIMSTSYFPSRYAFMDNQPREHCLAQITKHRRFDAYTLKPEKAHLAASERQLESFDENFSPPLRGALHRSLVADWNSGSASLALYLVTISKSKAQRKEVSAWGVGRKWSKISTPSYTSWATKRTWTCWRAFTQTHAVTRTWIL